MKAIRLHLPVMLAILTYTVLTSMRPAAHAADPPAGPLSELIVLNWSEYIDPALVGEFEKRFNTRVKEIYYQSDEKKDEMLLHTKGKGYDVVIGSGHNALSYRKRKWLSPVTDLGIPNGKYIDEKFFNAYPELAGYGVPYTWGFTGIVYRKDLIGETVTSWNQLFRPAPLLRGRIMMIDDSEDTIGPALKALGYPVNSDQPEHYDAVEKLLLAQKPFVKKFGAMALTSENAMVTGKIWMAPAYNGDALALHEIHPAIELALPAEGVSLWVDFIMVMEASPRKQLAMDFINFIHEPEHAAQLAEYLMYATPNQGATAHLSAQHLNNPLIYPATEVLAKSEFERPASPRVIHKRNIIFKKLLP